jgi:cytochrome P450
VGKRRVLRAVPTRAFVTVPTRGQAGAIKRIAFVMNIHATPPFVPPRPQPPAQSLGLFRFFSTVRRNALAMWPAAAYEEDVLAGNTLGRKSFLLNAPDAIHHVLVDNTENYRRSAATIRILGPIVGNGLLLSEGDDWRHQRRTVAPALAPRVIPMLARHIAVATEPALARLAAAKGEPVDLLAGLQYLALDIAARSMFSLETARFGAAMRAMIEDYAARLGQPNFFDLMLPVGFATLRDRARRRFRKRWLALMDEIVAARLREPPADKPRDLFDILHAARDPETGAAFSHEQLRDQMATMIVAGHETTALALFWSIYLLAMAPDEQERVADEVHGVELGPEDAASALPKLAFTRAVVSESLRLFPPAFAIARLANAADRAGGIDIPRGALVMIAPWVLHRHRRLWDNPDAFIPSRFLDAEPRRFSYLPFGVGPRVCVGAQFALTEAVLVLAAAIKRFRVTLADNAPVLPAAAILSHPDRAAPFRLEARR